MAELASRSASAESLGFVREGSGPTARLRGPRTGYKTSTNPIVLPLSMEGGWPVVTVGLNGALSVPMLFDTGAQFTTLDGRTAARAGVRLVNTNDIPEGVARGAAGRERTVAALVDRVTLGGLEITNLGVKVRLQEVNASSLRVKSLLGFFPVIAGMSYVTLDYPGNTLVLAPRDEYVPPANPIRVPLQIPFELGDLGVRITVALPNGHRAGFDIDTGWSGEFILNDATIRDAGLEQKVRSGPQIALHGVGGVTLEKGFTLDWIEIGGRRYAYIEGTTGSWTTFNLIGTGWLKQFRVTFDFRKKVLWLE